MRSRPSRSRRAERGFALMEVMVASAILGVVALSLIRFWSVFDGLSFDLLLRQKAVFVLNGEMARLNNLYTTTGFITTPKTSTTGYSAVSGIPGSGARLTFPTNSPSIDFVVTSSASFAAADQLVLVVGSGTATRDHVWLDRDRQMTARIGWTEGAVACTPTPGCGQCYTAAAGGGTCSVVTLFLEYPFKLSNGVPTPFGTTKTLTLSTIVGRRM